MLGYSDEWAVTFFSKTLFTPAGIDIYTRSEQGMDEEIYREIINGLKAVGGDVAKIAEGMFPIKRGDGLEKWEGGQCSLMGISGENLILLYRRPSGGTESTWSRGNTANR